MSFEHRTGNIFNQPDLQAMGHGVNCKGKMGSGIAVEFKNRFKAMHAAYVEHCKNNTLQLGMVFPWYEEPDDVWIFNMASQYHTGRDARMDALMTSFEKVLGFCERKGITTLGLPQIGCGIGGLDWDEVSAALEARADQSSVHVVLITFEP